MCYVQQTIVFYLLGPQPQANGRASAHVCNRASTLCVRFPYLSWRRATTIMLHLTNRPSPQTAHQSTLNARHSEPGSGLRLFPPLSRQTLSSPLLTVFPSAAVTQSICCSIYMQHTRMHRGGVEPRHAIYFPIQRTCERASVRLRPSTQPGRRVGARASRRCGARVQQQQQQHTEKSGRTGLAAAGSEQSTRTAQHTLTHHTSESRVDHSSHLFCDLAVSSCWCAVPVERV